VSSFFNLFEPRSGSHNGASKNISKGILHNLNLLSGAKKKVNNFTYSSALVGVSTFVWIVFFQPPPSCSLRPQSMLGCLPNVVSAHPLQPCARPLVGARKREGAPIHRVAPLIMNTSLAGDLLTVVRWPDIHCHASVCRQPAPRSGFPPPPGSPSLP
jgi:hypothetical protein